MFRRSGLTCLLALLVTVPAFSSLAQPAAAGSLPNSPEQAKPSPGPVATLKTAARLVFVDVAVTDSKQNAIHNLKASDFVVLENGAAQQVTGFEEHVGLTAAQMAKIVPMRPLPPGIFTNFTPGLSGSAINLLLLDSLNTQMKDQSYVREQLREFLKNSPVGTRIAIFGLGERLVMLQGFTSELALLKAVVSESKPSASKTMPDSVGNGGTPSVSQLMGQVAGADMAQLLTSVQEFESWEAGSDSQNRAKMTLDAMNQLAHYLAGIPGRKNLIWFSGSFPLNLMPESSAGRPFDSIANSEAEFRETTTLLARSQVAVYPISARGVRTNAPAISMDAGPSNISRGLAVATGKASQEGADDDATMNRMDVDTGGQAYVNTNGLSEAVGKAIGNGANYYTLSYTPTNSKQDGAFRKIQIKLAAPGAGLSYRTGYYADDAGARQARGTEAAEKAVHSLPVAMLRGAPDATEILLKLQVLPANIAEERDLAPGNVFNKDAAAKLKVKGPFKRYAIDVAADAKEVQITPTPDGRSTFLVELVTYVYDARGVLINLAAQRAKGNLTPTTYLEMRRTGLPFHEEISVPVAGEYYLRISLHDLETDRYGSVEIPVAKVAKLAPAAAVVPVPAK